MSFRVQEQNKSPKRSFNLSSQFTVLSIFYLQIDLSAVNKLKRKEKFDGKRGDRPEGTINQPN